MAKKVIILILSLCLAFSLAACGGGEPVDVSVEEFVKPDNYATVLLVSINPQVRLYIGKDGVVLAVEPVNDDAKQIMDGIHYENTDYQTVITEFISAANNNGYIKEDAQIEFEIVETKDEEIDGEAILDKSSEAAEHTAEDLDIPLEVVRKPHHGHGDRDKDGKDDKPEETTEPHIHEFSEATCIRPSTCDCGETEGEPLGHTMQPATCTAPMTCSVCGASEGAALPHKFTEATCTTAKTCTVCGNIEGDALGHSFTNATCTAAKTCTVCGAAEGTALGHSFTDATCTAPKTCTVCGATEGNAAGHSYSGDTCVSCGAVDPTYKPLSPGVWQCYSLSNEVLYRFQLTFRAESITYVSVWFGPDVENIEDEELRNTCLESGPLVEYQGKQYYVAAGDGCEAQEYIDGDTVTLKLFFDSFQGEIMLKRTAGNQYTVVYASGLETYFNQAIADALPAGSVFVWISE